MISRRKFLKWGIGAGIGLALPLKIDLRSVYASVAIPDQEPLPGRTISKYIDPLPVFGSSQGLAPGQVNAPRVDITTGTPTSVSMHEVQQKVLPESFYAALADEYKAGTWVWAYDVGGRGPLYPGVTIEARRGTPAMVTYINNLPYEPLYDPNNPADSNLITDLTAKLEAYVTTDQSIHWSDPFGMMLKDDQTAPPYYGPPPVVAHLHGAEVPSTFDGGPNQWFTPDGRHGQGYCTYTSALPNQAVYYYPNQQEATTLWFHDHALGATRLNVYRGLAAFYLLRDNYDTGQGDNPLGLPAGQFEREIAIQDRQFDTNGQLYFPDGDNSANLNGAPPNPEIHPYWNPEFFGDVMVVNGKSWPYLNVQPRRYRFRLLDGCNARFLELSLLNKATGKPGPAIWVIGSDGGLLDFPGKFSDLKNQNGPRLLMAPGERFDVIVDFSGFQGQTLTLVNSAKAPYPSGMAPDPHTFGEVMQLRVNLPLSGVDASYNPASGLPLRGSGKMPAIIRLADPSTGTKAASVAPKATRQLVLVEVEGAGGPIEVLVNNTEWDGKRGENPIPDPSFIDDGMDDYVSELPQVGSTEIWEIVNLTMDAHPIHLHLVQFQLMNRQGFNAKKYRSYYDSLFPGGTYGGQLDDGAWGMVSYPAGVFIPAYGPPLAYDGSDPRSAGKLGGNPDVTAYLNAALKLPLADETGWKDTMKMYPGEVTRVVVRFAPQDLAVNAVQPGTNAFPFDPTQGPGYVWHCHIVDHEDNEMMRPYHPVP